jgi:hypothetical protein
MNITVQGEQVRLGMNIPDKKFSPGENNIRKKEDLLVGPAIMYLYLHIIPRCMGNMEDHRGESGE